MSLGIPRDTHDFMWRGSSSIVDTLPQISSAVEEVEPADSLKGVGAIQDCKIRAGVDSGIWQKTGQKAIVGYESVRFWPSVNDSDWSAWIFKEGHESPQTGVGSWMMITQWSM